MKRRILVSAVLSVLLLTALAANVHATEVKLTASDGAAGDFFGYSVAISGDYAVVGAREDDDAGSASGSAYIFKRDGTVWTEQAKITASDGAAGDLFGMSVAISGDYAVVG
ncbi:MAG: FG-GAP repeat protein, partial [Euryarchaeota archaeon]|nr:FG-GAP repeat protein [Euryarchaeota archaeon]